MAPRGIASRGAWGSKAPRRRGLDARVVYPFIGRVRIRESWPELEGRDDFYIGSRSVNADGFTVVSWQAGAAELFFSPSRARDVQLTRTFEKDGDSVVNFEDDQHVQGSRFPAPARPRLTGPPGPNKRPPAVDGSPRIAGPATPSDVRARGANRPTSPTRVPPPLRRTDAANEADKQTVRPPEEASVHRSLPRPPSPLGAPDVPQAAPSTLRAPKPDLRAEQLLRKKLHATRRDGLRDTLATVQGDQYGLITRPRRSNLIVQGNPGTGKTLIAAYRLAYLVGDGSDDLAERRDPRLKRVLLLGPSDTYAEKIGEVALDLGVDRRHTIDSAANFLAFLRGGPPETVVGDRARKEDADPAITQIVEHAARLVQSANRPDWNSDPRRAIYEHLKIAKVAASKRIASRWLRRLPSYAESIQRRSYQYLHEYIGAVSVRTFMPAGSVPPYDHVIVDEGQDLTALQWHTLMRACPSATWTVLGDTAQRRDRLGLTRWDSLSELIRRSTAQPCSVTEIAVGYRSTRQILDFAARLLPTERQMAYSIQSGPPPSVIRVPARSFDDSLTKHIMELHQRHPSGSVAVIARVDRSLTPSLQRLGWQYNKRKQWMRGQVEVTVLSGQGARGLEFDAVVIVEPSELMDGKETGRLYSALTRANRELVVLHSKPLPRQLR